MPEHQTDILQITDFRMAGFLVSKGAKFTGTSLNDKGEVLFWFDDEAGLTTKVLNSYPNSNEQRYDAACRTMHDFVRIATRRK